VIGLSGKIRRAAFWSFIRITDSYGNTAKYFAGSPTASRSEYYAMQKGNNNVYIISAHLADTVRFTINDMRLVD